MAPSNTIPSWSRSYIRWLSQISFLLKYLFMTTLTVDWWLCLCAAYSPTHQMKFSLRFESDSFPFFLLKFHILFSTFSPRCTPIHSLVVELPFYPSHSIHNVCYRNIFDNKSCEGKYNSSHKDLCYWIPKRIHSCTTHTIYHMIQCQCVYKLKFSRWQKSKLTSSNYQLPCLATFYYSSLRLDFLFMFWIFFRIRCFRLERTP